MTETSACVAGEQDSVTVIQSVYSYGGGGGGGGGGQLSTFLDFFRVAPPQLPTPRSIVVSSALKSVLKM